MNDQVKQLIIENEKQLLINFPQFENSIKAYIKKIELINHDMDLYDFISASFKLKKEQEDIYNSKNYLSSRQIIENNKQLLDQNDNSNIDKLDVFRMYSYLDVCCISKNFNLQVGMYYLEKENAVIIKTTVEDNNRPYDDRWFNNNRNILIYCMQKEKEENIKNLSFKNKPNFAIFNSLMSGNLIDVHVFSNRKKGDMYKYEGIFHPCGLIDDNTSFLLFRDGHDDEIPYRNFDGQLFAALQKTGTIPELGSHLVEDITEECKEFNGKKLKKSKRNAVQQLVIDFEVSLRGEQLVVQHEKELLKKRGLNDLANKVLNISLADSSLGFDVLSYDVKSNGEIEEKYIIVKTSVIKDTLSYVASSKEMKYIMSKDKRFSVYRVYDIYTDEPKYQDVTNKSTRLLSQVYGVEVL